MNNESGRKGLGYITAVHVHNKTTQDDARILPPQPHNLNDYFHLYSGGQYIHAANESNGTFQSKLTKCHETRSTDTGHDSSLSEKQHLHTANADLKSDPEHATKTDFPLERHDSGFDDIYTDEGNGKMPERTLSVHSKIYGKHDHEGGNENEESVYHELREMVCLLNLYQSILIDCLLRSSQYFMLNYGISNNLDCDFKYLMQVSKIFYSCPVVNTFFGSAL